MVKLSFSPGKITCLFCGDTQTDEDLMGHISVKHLKLDEFQLILLFYSLFVSFNCSYLRFKCSECEFKSVYPGNKWHF